jgi:hypothetical protein
MTKSPIILTGSIVSLILAAGSGNAFAQINTAENLLVDLDASGLTPGTLGSWSNSGTLGSSFNAASPGGNNPSIQVHTVDGVKGVVFDGRQEWMVGPSTAGTAIEGLDPNRTVELWVYSGNVQGEESGISWGHRGGPDGSNASLGYGRHSAWGALGQWGAPDIGFDPNKNVASGDRSAYTDVFPTAGQWHHIVYTYDGRVSSTVSAPTLTTRLYVDGVQVNSEILAAGAINTFVNQPFILGAQNNNAGNGVEDNNNTAFSGALAKVRVHEGVLSAAQIQQNYNLERSGFNRAGSNYNKPTDFLGSGPIHRYNFGNASGAASDGDTVLDLAGSAHGTIRGANALFTGTGLDLPGGSSQSEAYVDLPNGILSSIATGNLTLEAWVQQSSIQSWARIWDFGTGQLGEILGPGGDAQGTQYIMAVPSQGTGNDGAFEFNGAASPNGGGFRGLQESVQLGVELHHVMTYDALTDLWKYYINSNLVGEFTDTLGFNSLTDVNNWLGRSNWTSDANLDGTFNEFRIYDYALTDAQIAGNFNAGPDLVNIPEPGAASLLVFGALTLARRRRTWIG